VAGVGIGTGYAVYNSRYSRKPKNVNGLGIMLVAGAVGTMGDWAYGWTTACRPYVDAWNAATREQERLKKKQN